LAAVLIILENLTWLLYTVVMHARYGQTVGKMVTRVRVVDFRTEGKISWRQALLREGIPTLVSLGFIGYEVYAILVGKDSLDPLSAGETVPQNLTWLISGLPALWFLAEVLTMLTNKKRRALHDFIAGTVVVRTNVADEATQPDASLNPSPVTPSTGPTELTSSPGVS